MVFWRDGLLDTVSLPFRIYSELCWPRYGHRARMPVDTVDERHHLREVLALAGGCVLFTPLGTRSTVASPLGADGILRIANQQGYISWGYSPSMLCIVADFDYAPIRPRMPRSALAGYTRRLPSCGFCHGTTTISRHSYRAMSMAYVKLNNTHHVGRGLAMKICRSAGAAYSDNIAASGICQRRHYCRFAMIRCNCQFPEDAGAEQRKFATCERVKDETC